MKAYIASLLLLCNLTCSTILSGQWSGITTFVPVNGVNVVWATDANTVFAVYDNKVIKSSNGGTSWSEQPLGTTNYNFNAEDIHFFDAQHGMIVGDLFFGFLAMCYSTHDGGQTWLETQLNSGQNQIESVRMVSANVAYAAGWHGSVYKTTDGGATWTQFFIPGANEHWNDLEFPDAQHGYLVSNDFRLFYTDDGGASWQIANIPPDAKPQDIQFLDSQNGLMFGLGGLYKTTDGGQTWTLSAANSSLVSGVMHFNNLNEGWAASGIGMYKTIDGGQTWLKQHNFQMNPYFSDIHFSGSTGWAVGSTSNGYGLIYKAVNHGGIGVALTVPATPTCYFEKATFTCQHNGATQFDWFVNGQNQGVNNPVFEFTPWFDDLYNVYCKASNGTQTVNTDVHQLQVYTDPILPLAGSVTQDSICRGSSINIEVGLIFSGRQYRIQSGNNILSSFTGTGQPYLNWNSGPLDTTTTFDFYALFENCPGWKKLNSLTVHVVEKPQSIIGLQPDASLICEHEPLNIQLDQSEPGVLYQVRANGTASGAAQIGTGGPLILTATGLVSNTILSVEALASTFCRSTINESIPVTVQIVDPYFATSSRTIGIGEPLFVENTSSDSLQFLWRFSNGAAPGTSSLQHPSPVLMTQPGMASVELVGISPAGCRDSIQVPLNVLDAQQLDTDWALPILANGERIIGMDHQGNIYGYTFGKTELLDRASSSVLTVQAISGVFYKYDKRGVLQWYNTFDDGNGIPLGARVYDMHTDPQGNTYYMVSLIGGGDQLNLSSTDGKGVHIDKRNCWVLVKYSPNGVLKWVRCIEMRSAQGQEIDYLAFWPLSTAIDAEENLFITANLDNTQYPSYLVLSTPDTYLDTIPFQGSQYTQYVIKVEKSNKFGWVAEHVEKYSWFSSFCGFYSSGIVKPDAAGGCYLWLNGGKSDSRAMQLVHFDASGQITWKFQWGGGEANNVLNYAWANDMQVDEAGNIYLLGSASGISDYINSNTASGQPGVFLIKMSPQGTVRWARAFRQNHWIQSSYNPYAIGLGLDGDRMHMLCEIQQEDPWVFTNWQCFDSLFEKDHRLFWTTWDTLGNLLQVRAADIFERALIGSNAVSSRVKAFDGKIYFLGNAYNQPGGQFWGVSLPANVSNPNSRRFLAAITDSEDYVPYINTCELTRCVLDSVAQIQVSYLFSDIQWQKNGVDLPGYATPAIVPPDSASYTVTATNPAGIQHLSPTPTQVQIFPVPSAEVQQVGPNLVASTYYPAVYYWYDSDDELVFVSVDPVFTPAESGWYRVEINGLESCDATGTPAYFDLAHSATSEASEEQLFTLAPNPNTGVFSLTVAASQTERSELRIFDAQGKQVHTQQLGSVPTSLQINVINLPPGMYWAQLSMLNGSTSVAKFIKI